MPRSLCVAIFGLFLQEYSLKQFNAGGADAFDNAIDNILIFNISLGSWEILGKMKSKRFFHDISVVNTSDVINYCS